SLRTGSCSRARERFEQTASWMAERGFLPQESAVRGRRETPPPLLTLRQRGLKPPSPRRGGWLGGVSLPHLRHHVDQPRLALGHHAHGPLEGRTEVAGRVDRAFAVDPEGAGQGGEVDVRAGDVGADTLVLDRPLA